MALKPECIKVDSSTNEVDKRMPESFPQKKSKS